MTTSDGLLSLTDFFKSPEYDDQYYHIDQMPEQLSKKLTVRILLDPNFNLDALTTKLWADHKLKLTRSPSRPGIVVISGTPSSSGTTEDQILQVVQDYQPNARLSK